MRRFAPLMALALLALDDDRLHAAPVTVTNASFEQDSVPDGGFPVSPYPNFPHTLPAGWQPYDPDNILNGNNNSIGIVNPNTEFFTGGAVPDGNNAALVFLQNNAGTAAGIRQVLSATLMADTRYTLSVWIGDIASGTGSGAYADYGFFDLEGFPGYRVELWAGSHLLVRDDNSLAAAFSAFATEGNWLESTIQYTSGNGDEGLGENLEIRLINLNETGTVDAPNVEVDFDHVRLDASAVPEPGTGALVFLGLGLLASRRRR